MKILAFETSHAPMSVALSVGEAEVIKFGSAWQRTSEEIVLLIESVLSQAALSLAQIDAVALSYGPGSFTALRIGMSTAKGLCFALDKPLVTVGTLEAMALAAEKQVRNEGQPIATLVPVIYSKADEFFVGEIAPVALRENLLLEIPKCYLTINELSQRYPKGTGKVVCGRRPEKLRPQIETCLNWHELDFSAAALLPIAKEKMRKAMFADLAFAEPLYLKNFEAKKSTKKFFG
ncbi:MAG: tRNA (adenosine(37)-N6)-threonylcarbamoyltransferase complex dimerization subunit type 1 TsaB [Candidatus Thermochlorobacter sp.]